MAIKIPVLKFFQEIEDSVYKNEQAYGYVYVSYNTISGKYYIGLTRSNKFKSSYVGSGVLIRKAINKYGKENFEVKVLEWCFNEQELKDREEYWISYFKASESDKFYNLSIGGESKKGVSMSEDVKNLHRRLNTGKKASDETKRRMSIANKKKWKVKGYRDKLSRIQKQAQKRSYLNGKNKPPDRTGSTWSEAQRDVDRSKCKRLISTSRNGFFGWVEVREMRKTYISRDKKYGTNAWADRLGISRRTVNDIIQQRTWKEERI